MKTKILLGLVLPIFLLAIFAGEALGAAKESKHSVHRALPVDGAQPPSGEYTGPSPVFYESGRQPDCEDVNPVEPIVIIQHEEWASTYYDYQQNGSMGRMIAVSCGGHRHMVCHETEGPYTTFPRYVTYNCKNPVSVWCGPSRIDGGPGINAGYAQMMVMHHGLEVALYHRTAPPIGCWNSTLARGAGVEYQCICYIDQLYDIPDEHDYPVSTEPDGFWPKGYVMYDALVDTDYIHIVTTENSPEGEVYQTVAYQRCAFEATDIVCYAPKLPNDPYGPYRRSPGAAGDPDDSVAVFDTITTISAIVTGSPVSKRVAIVYTKPRHHPDGGGCTHHNNDVVYCESMNNGGDWFAAGAVEPCTNITQYAPLVQERAFTDVAACYDYNDSLHIVWTAVDFDSVTCTGTNGANLMHWSKATGISMVAPGYWGGTNPGAWNYNICKPSISAKDPIYHPGGDPDDSVFLFCTWTQFDSGDVSLAGRSNGDIYTAGSNDGGEKWADGFNLTNTKTPDCVPGECLSEHWSSMAENMYDGDLHIEYVCDRDAGGMVHDEGEWTDNPMMYMHVEQFPIIDACAVSYKLIEPTEWCTPPLKILPDDFRIVVVELTGRGNIGGDYEVSSAHPQVTCQVNCAGTLEPGDKVEVSVKVECPPGEEGFIAATVEIHVCIGTDDEKTFYVPLHAVCSDDNYYECPVDPRTWIIKENCKCSLWVCCNTEQRVWDKRILDFWGRTLQSIFSAGSAVATTWQGDTVVGRQDYRDTRTGARDTINVDEGYLGCYSEPCTVQLVYVRNTFICANHLQPPNHLKWWWIDIHKQIIMLHGPDCPEWKKEQIIKKIWITKSQPPVWWPEAGVGAQAYEEIKLGYFADVDAPSDKSCLACNQAGYDPVNYIMWQSGHDADGGTHQHYLDYYVGLALTTEDGVNVEPWAAHNVVNEEYLYPQGGWGWKDGELYRLMNTPGVTIDSGAGLQFLDRTWVFTAKPPIPAGTGDFHQDFILIEAFIPGGPGTGLTELVTHIEETKAILIPELNELELFREDYQTFVCGDCTGDQIVNVADLVCLASYLFGGGPPPDPLWKGDCTGDGIVNVADLVCMATYLFSHGPKPDCCGFGRQPPG